MSYKVSFPENNAFTGNHMGLTFTHGEAYTNDSFLASRLQSKGYRVTAEADADDETVPDQGEAAEAPPDIDDISEIDIIKAENATIAQLREYAAKNHISLGSARTKAEIMEAISCGIGTATE